MTKKTIKVYPVYITWDATDKVQYFVEIPDFKGFTQGMDLAEAIVMARDYIKGQIIARLEDNQEVPEPDSGYFDQKPEQIRTFVDIDLAMCRRRADFKVVKKNLTIPSYLNELGMAAGLNFSAILTAELKKILFTEED